MVSFRHVLLVCSFEMRSFARVLGLQSLLLSQLSSASPAHISADLDISDHVRNGGHGTLGAVASENTLCSEIGIDLLKQGGNAADAHVGKSLSSCCPSSTTSAFSSTTPPLCPLHPSGGSRMPCAALPAQRRPSGQNGTQAVQLLCALLNVATSSAGDALRRAGIPSEQNGTQAVKSPPMLLNAATGLAGDAALEYALARVTFARAGDQNATWVHSWRGDVVRSLISISFGFELCYPAAHFSDCTQAQRSASALLACSTAVLGVVVSHSSGAQVVLMKA